MARENIPKNAIRVENNINNNNNEDNLKKLREIVAEMAIEYIKNNKK